MQLHVKSRYRLEEYNPLTEDHIIISIWTPGDEPANPAKNAYTADILSLNFHDIDRLPCNEEQAAEWKSWGVKLFCHEHAKRIVLFVDYWVELEIDHIIVHCDAGLSRSPGVAAALALKYNGDDREFWSGTMYGGMRFHPNSHVYNVMLQALGIETKPLDAT